MTSDAVSAAVTGSRRRIVLFVAVAAAVAAAAVVGVTLVEMRGQTTTLPGSVTQPRTGVPPLELDFGLANDQEAQTLGRAQTLYDRGKLAQAAALFGRYHSLEARIGSAFAAWKAGHGLGTLEQLAARHPHSALVALHLGLADLWAGRNGDALLALERAAKLQPDTPYAVDAENLLYRKLPQGLPPIVLGIPLPSTIAKLSTRRQVAVLRREAGGPDVQAKLLYGAALWSLERPVSAEREFAAAARLAPHDPVARTAAAVGLFTKAEPVRAFAKLGPLTAVFPHSPVVELHLGVLLIYIGERKKAAEHLHAAVADGPHTAYAKPARQLLRALGT
ncbi:MAG TPA: hypothetical protein VE088_03040 [Gaiellaceae bacterium]|nr:hypothetical protein [Gaiellaceae bacterium]